MNRLALVVLAAVAAGWATFAASAEPDASQGMSIVPAAPAAPSEDPDRPKRTRSGKVSASTDPARPPAFGPLPAKVRVIVFSDFQCPVCRRIVDATHQIAEEFPGDVRVEFRAVALPSHGYAKGAAVAALAAQRQGRFWEMHDLLFANQGALDAASLEGYAGRLGLDVARFRKDVADAALRARVEEDGELAKRLGVSGTPGLVVNGRVNVGWGSWYGFRSIVEKELAAANEAVGKGTPLAEVHLVRARQNVSSETVLDAYKVATASPARSPRSRSSHG